MGLLPWLECRCSEEGLGFSDHMRWDDHHFKRKLSDFNLKVGDLVVLKGYYKSVKASTGGIIYQVVEDTPPVRPHTNKKMVTVNKRQYNPSTNSYDTKQVKEEQYGYWDEQGRKIMDSAVKGFVRVKPLFEFFATHKGKKPSGKGETIIITYDEINHELERVELVTLCTKYADLGNLIKDVARHYGMDGDADGS